MLQYLLAHSEHWDEYHYGTYDEMTSAYGKFKMFKGEEAWIAQYIPGMDDQDMIELYHDTIVYWDFDGLTKFVFPR